MKTTKSYILFFICTTLLKLPLLTGCAPVISQAILQQVDKSIDFERLHQEPERYKGKMVLLGGDIIETKNVPGRTTIVILARTLNYRNQPIKNKGSTGRFILYQPGFLDPAIYRSGRQITVAGIVTGKELRPLGEITYSYPVITNRELYLWPEDQYYRGDPAVHFGVGVGVGL